MLQGNSNRPTNQRQLLDWANILNKKDCYARVVIAVDKTGHIEICTNIVNFDDMVYFAEKFLETCQKIKASNPKPI